jgi:hypothetical protein
VHSPIHDGHRDLLQVLIPLGRCYFSFVPLVSPNAALLWISRSLTLLFLCKVFYLLFLHLSSLFLPPPSLFTQTCPILCFPLATAFGSQQFCLLLGFNWTRMAATVGILFYDIFVVCTPIQFISILLRRMSCRSEAAADLVSFQLHTAYPGDRY